MPSRVVVSAIPQTMMELCEQVHPRVLEIRRVQESWVAGSEKRALLWLAARTPLWIGPDHLTMLGLAGQIGAAHAMPWRRGTGIGWSG